MDKLDLKRLKLDLKFRFNIKIKANFISDKNNIVMKTNALKIVLVGIILMCVSCGVSKVTYSPEDLAKVQSLIDNDTIRIESSRAYPQNMAQLSSIGVLPPGNGSGHVNLVSNPNHFFKAGDSLSIYLPYYGTRQMGGQLGSNNIGIEFNGKPKKTQYSFNEKKNSHKYEFLINNNSESFDIQVLIFPSFKTEILINSTHRTSISYNGNVVE